MQLTSIWPLSVNSKSTRTTKLLRAFFVMKNILYEPVCPVTCVTLFIIVPHLIIFYGLPIIDDTPLTSVRGLAVLYVLLAFVATMIAQKRCLGSNLSIAFKIVLLGVVCLRLIPVPEKAYIIYGDYVLTFLPLAVLIGGLFWGYLAMED